MKTQWIAVATTVLAVGIFMFSLVESQTGEEEELELRRSHSEEEVELRKSGKGGGKSGGKSKPGGGGKSKPGGGGKSSGITKYKSKSSLKSFGKKAVVFGAGAYIGGKVAKKV
jgi:hypothetical protein